MLEKEEERLERRSGEIGRFWRLARCIAAHMDGKFLYYVVLKNQNIILASPTHCRYSTLPPLDPAEYFSQLNSFLYI